jgi:hypothetical protein
VLLTFGFSPSFTRRATNQHTLQTQWLRATMNAVGSLVAASVVGTVLWQAGSLGGSSAGLTLSYATQFTQTVMWLFRIMTSLEVLAPVRHRQPAHDTPLLSLSLPPPPQHFV